MLITLFNWFTKITAWPFVKIIFRIRVLYEDKNIQGRKITGPAIVVSNHTAVWDYAAMLFVFFGRTLRVPMAEVLFQKKALGLFLKAMGGIRVNRADHDFRFMVPLEDVLQKGGVVMAFPESRIPNPGEERPLAFKPSMAYLALKTGIPVIPVYTNGDYFSRSIAKVVIGKPMDMKQFCSDPENIRQSIEEANTKMREAVIALEKLANG